MNYSKIQNLLDSNKNLRKGDLLKKVGKSNWGFNEMVAKRSMRVDVLEKMSEFFDVPISYWFDEDNKENNLKEGQSDYLTKTNNMKKMIEILEKQMAEKDGQIKFLQNQLERSQGIEGNKAQSKQAM